MHQSSWSRHVPLIDIIITKKQLEALLPEALSIRGSACGGMIDYMGSFERAAWEY